MVLAALLLYDFSQMTLPQALNFTLTRLKAKHCQRSERHVMQNSFCNGNLEEGVASRTKMRQWLPCLQWKDTGTVPSRPARLLWSSQRDKGHVFSLWEAPNLQM